jgi:hypothetical protein
MTRAEYFALISRLNEISDLGNRLGDSYLEILAHAAADLRWALAEGRDSFRVRIGRLVQANRLIERAYHIRLLGSTHPEQHPDHTFLLNAAEIVLSEIGACAGEKRHDWKKLYRE